VLLETHQLVSTVSSAHLEHHPVASVGRQIVEHRMLGEVEVLNTRDFSVEGGDLDVEQQFFEAFHEDLDVRVLLLGFFLQLVPESEGLARLFVLLQVDHLWILVSLLGAGLSIAFQFLQNDENVEDIAYLAVEFLTSSSLFADKSDDLAIPETLEDLFDEPFLDVVVSELIAEILFFLVVVGIFEELLLFLFDLLATNAELGCFGF
jgi:hypothetical protein